MIFASGWLWTMILLPMLPAGLQGLQALTTTPALLTEMGSH
jgi:hypothetical protein